MELWFTEKQSKNLGITLKIKRCLCHKKTEYQQLDILESFEFGKILLLDGLIMITEKDEFVYHEMITHVPCVSHPNPKRVLIIGGGDGGTVREILKHPEVEKVDLVEIDKGVIDACLEYFPYVSSGLNDPRVTVNIGDGIKFIKDLHDIYDLVIIDSTDPIGPAVGLFEVEFYNKIRKALKADGVIVAQSESPFQDTNTWIRIHRNLSSCFTKTFSYLAFIPTYPAGMWSFTFASNTIHPVNDMNDARAQQISNETRYYNPSIHKASFNLPNFLIQILKKTS